MNHDDTLNDPTFWAQHDTREIARILRRYSILFTVARFAKRYWWPIAYVTATTLACLLLAATVVLTTGGR